MLPFPPVPRQGTFLHEHLARHLVRALAIRVMTVMPARSNNDIWVTLRPTVQGAMNRFFQLTNERYQTPPRRILLRSFCPRPRYYPHAILEGLWTACQLIAPVRALPVTITVLNLDTLRKTLVTSDLIPACDNDLEMETQKTET